MSEQWWLVEAGIFMVASIIYWLIIFRVLGRHS